MYREGEGSIDTERGFKMYLVISNSIAEWEIKT